MDNLTPPRLNKALSHILIVDDSLDHLDSLGNLLSEQGYHVEQAVSGEIALEILRDHVPHLILLDLMMPNLDGYEVYHRLKDNPETADIPVIFLSGEDELVDPLRTFAMGGVDYIAKPYHPVEVLVRVANQLKIQRLQRQLQHRNEQLQREIEEVIETQGELQSLNQQLEHQVAQRTLQLRDRNAELLELQNQLEKSLITEQSLSTLKSQLINTISHQFRTPLTVISSSASLIRRILPKTEQLDCEPFFQKIDQSVNNITQMLDDVITMAKINANDLKADPQPCNILTSCQNLMHHWQLPPHSLHQLRCVTEGNLPQWMCLDPILLQKLLIQLLSNAIRYSPQGGEILLKLKGEPNIVHLSVQDSGIGIPSAEQDKIGELFYRASNANSIPGTPGTGLGLAIVKWIVEQHDGQLNIESECDRGTTITVSFPIVLNPTGE
ncbi:hybrid sensor histidine kinase/response regulator [Spirulina subsalsa FACHB-351]|uniref:histidine kinase n=1 Tax=Spirulina subsalsa FACHB-351 TaxID=234711 RepID=A0ABT3L954_9CYAN|nr:hybrid sensor histidine kinase/response regulator [Spirulina subsalsa]MCW6037629.1 hybrid sensor histidine kinase/response regulator [Spirulina subsalsa FACHB-351]